MLLLKDAECWKQCTPTMSLHALHNDQRNMKHFSGKPSNQTCPLLYNKLCAHVEATALVCVYVSQGEEPATVSPRHALWQNLDHSF